jgi:hypothetical protein
MGRNKGAEAALINCLRVCPVYKELKAEFEAEYNRVVAENRELKSRLGVRNFVETFSGRRKST